MEDSLDNIQTDQESAIFILQNAKDQIGEVLRNQEHVRLGVESHLNRAANFLHGLAGTAPDNGATPAFGPMTAFMGEPIIRPEPVNATDLAPSAPEKEAFRAKRDELLNSIADKSDDDVFAILKQPQGEALLRNVGRRAGVNDYDTAEIDTQYLASVREGLDLARAKAEAVITGKLATTFEGAGIKEVVDTLDQADNVGTFNAEELTTAPEGAGALPITDPKPETPKPAPAPKSKGK